MRPGRSASLSKLRLPCCGILSGEHVSTACSRWPESVLPGVEAAALSRQLQLPSSSRSQEHRRPCPGCRPARCQPVRCRACTAGALRERVCRPPQARLRQPGCLAPDTARQWHLPGTRRGLKGRLKVLPAEPACRGAATRQQWRRWQRRQDMQVVRFLGVPELRPPRFRGRDMRARAESVERLLPQVRRGRSAGCACRRSGGDGGGGHPECRGSQRGRRVWRTRRDRGSRSGATISQRLGGVRGAEGCPGDHHRQH